MLDDLPAVKNVSSHHAVQPSVFRKLFEIIAVIKVDRKIVCFLNRRFVEATHMGVGHMGVGLPQGCSHFFILQATYKMNK